MQLTRRELYRRICCNDFAAAIRESPLPHCIKGKISNISTAYRDRHRGWHPFHVAASFAAAMIAA
jgi:hypothetical protein